MLRDALASLPVGLDGTYGRVLHAVKPRHKDYAVRALRWLAFSQRPLTLSEVAEAIAIDPERRPSFDRAEMLKRLEDILKICPSLVVITDDSIRQVNDKPPGLRLISLAHYFVKEYLLSQRVLTGDAAAFFMEADVTHSWLAKCCLWYLLRVDLPNCPDVYRHEDSQPAALAGYCMGHWIDHVRAVVHADSNLDDAVLELLDEDKNAYFNWVRRYDIDRTLPREGPLPSANYPSPLYVASRAGLAGAVKRILSERNLDVNAYCGFFGTALQAALYAQHTPVVDLLVGAGARCDIQTAEAMREAGIIQQGLLGLGLIQPASALTILETTLQQEQCASIAHTGVLKLVHLRRTAVIQDLLDRAAENDEQEPVLRGMRANV